MTTTQTKRCGTCKETLAVEMFYKNKSRADGLRNDCKQCSRVAFSRWQKANPEKVRAGSNRYYAANPEKVRARQAGYYEANPEQMRAKSAAWRKENPEKARARAARWQKANPEKVRARQASYDKARRADDPAYRLLHVQRTVVYHLLKSRGLPKNRRTREYLGCCGVALKAWLEAQFENGMTLAGHGAGPGTWQVDHVKPRASLPSDRPPTEEELRSVLHYRNQRPLWWRENMAKSSWHEGKRYVRGRVVATQGEKACLT